MSQILHPSVEALLKAADDAKIARAKTMPTEQDAIDLMFEAWQRLNELGWRQAMYCPKDGSPFLVIESGSTGIHECHYDGKWPDGTYWINDGDSWPSHPILWKRKPKSEVTR